MKKTADRKLENPKRWEQEIAKYLAEKYPFILEGVTKIEINDKDVSSEDGIGKIVYKDKINIPIIISEGTLREPNVGYYKGNIIPVDKGYFEKVINVELNSDQVEGRDGYHKRRINETGLFDIGGTGINKIGFHKVRVNFDNSKKLKGVIKNLDNPNIEEAIDKIASFTPHEEIYALKYEENSMVPFHYKTWMLKEGADGMYVSNTSMNEEELQMAKTAIVDRASNLNIDNEFVDPKKRDHVVENQSYSSSSRYSFKKLDGTVSYVNVKTSEGSEYSRYSTSKPVKLFGEGGEVKGIALFNKGRWGYGDIEYESDSPTDKPGYPPTDYTTGKALEGENIVFVVPNNISVPYLITKMERYRVGIEGKDVTVATMKSLLTGQRFMALLDQNIDKVTILNKQRVSNLGITILSNVSVYALPKTYSVYTLKGNLEDAKKLLTIKSFDPMLKSVITQAGGSYTIDVTKNNKTNTLKYLDKKAALMVMNYVTGEKHHTIREYDTHQEYVSKVASVKHLALNYEPGEWITLANRLEKEASVYDLTKELAGLEFIDTFKVKSLSNIKNDIIQLVEKLGEMLIEQRAKKNYTDISVLNQTYNKLVELWNNL